jgi:uracil-DNA glycosylase family 4
MTEATMQLDARQRAMLEEMGVKVWWPTAERMATSAAPEAPVAARERVAVVPPAANAPAAPDGTAAGVPAATPAARRTPGTAQTAAILIEPAIRLYDGSGPPENGWLLVVDTPPSADGRHDDEPFAGEAGRLLQNMLRALQLDRGTAPVHLARVHRSATGAPPGDVAPLSTGFAAQAASLAPRLVLALGPLSSQGLMQSDEPLGKLRGRVAQVQVDQGVAETPLVASYHPIYLLRNPADKAKAWADLCLAAAEFERVAS